MTKNCKNCGGHVSTDFARVYGDHNNKVWHCINCIEKEDGGREALLRGAGAYPTIQEAEERL